MQLRGYLIVLQFCSALIPYHAYSQDIDSDLLFKGVIKQSRDTSCGAAALSMLVSGTTDDSNISEMDVIHAIQAVSPQTKGEEQGYTLVELKKASDKLGHYAEWRKIAKSELPKIKQPVVILTGLNSEFPHFVVLKGVIDGNAYMADSVRGNIRMPYEELAKESLNQIYPAWYVMAINPSSNRPKNSILYLSTDKKVLYFEHFTVEQSNAITLVTLSKENQIISSYDFLASIGNHVDSAQANSHEFMHAVNMRYGITNDFEIGSSIQYLDGSQISDRKYNLYFNKRMQLDDSGKFHAIAGLLGYYSENNSLLGGQINFIGYTTTNSAQYLLGGSLGKSFRLGDRKNGEPPEYDYSYFVGANKPVGDRYLGSIYFTVYDGHNSDDLVKYERTYSLSTSLTYVYNKNFQFSPLLVYSFGAYEVLSFGISVAYIGSW